MADTRARYRDVFGIGEFRAVFAAHLLSMLGDVVAAVTLTVLVYEQTRSPALSAAVMALTFLPYLVGGTLFGAAADRYPARRVLVACDLISAVLVAVMALPGVPIVALLALVFLVNLMSPVFNSVRSATLPEILPPGPTYILGRSLLRMVSQSAQVVGYGLGGLLLAFVSTRTALALDSASFLASALLLRVGTLRRPARGGAVTSMARDSLAGVRAVLAHAGLRRILLFSWLVPACAVAPEALATPYVTHIGEPARAAGYLLTGLPVGTVVADVIAGRLLRPRGQRRIILPATALIFVPFAFFASRPDLLMATLLLGVSGLGFAQTAGLDALLIETAPTELRNRALAASSAGLMFIQGAGFALWGLAGQYLSLRLVIPAAGVAGIVTLACLHPRRRIS